MGAAYIAKRHRIVIAHRHPPPPAGKARPVPFEMVIGVAKAVRWHTEVFEPPDSVKDKIKRKVSAGFKNPYTDGEEALEPKELVDRCGLVARES